MVFPCVLCFLGVCSLIAAVILAVISLGFRRANTETTTGVLEKTDLKHDVFVAGMRGKWYRNLLDFSYAYRVDGVRYTASGRIAGTPEQLETTVSVVYQKNRPRLAYIKGMTSPIHPILAGLFCVAAAVFLIPGIVLLIPS